MKKSWKGEFAVLAAKMDKEHGKGWRSDKKILRIIKKAAKKSAKSSNHEK